MDAHTLNISPVFLAAKVAAKCGRFNPNGSFEIKMSGIYRLTHQQTLIQIGANGVPAAPILPMVTSPIEIQCGREIKAQILTLRQFHKILQQLQADLLAFLRVKLRGEDVVAPDGGCKGIAVFRPRGDN